jgi:hypothetical protein
MKPRSQYTATLERAESDCPIICVIDVGAACRSVTNDAEAVVAEVVERFGDHRIVYRDSDGVWDELAHYGTKFDHFIGIGAETPEAAMDRVRQQDKERKRRG